MIRSLKSRWAVPLVAAGLLLGTRPAVSQAQHFQFSIATGHHHHGCRPYGCGPGWGPYWGPGWYGPGFGFVYAPPPIVQERVIYVEPPRAAAWTPPANAVSSNLAPAAAAPRLTENSSDTRITIRNASGARLPVAFLVDGQDVELADGTARSFVGASRHTVSYDRGGRFGSTQQDLTPGDYEFRITPTGWDLVRQTDAAALSRSTVRTNTLPQVGTPR
jgi:hypothetical protein